MTSFRQIRARLRAIAPSGLAIAALLTTAAGCAFPDFEPSTGAPLTIAAVTGNSPLATAEEPGVLHDGLIVEGTGLDGGLSAVLRGGDGAVAYRLTVRSAAGDRAEVGLPTELEAGVYDLVLDRAGSSASVTVHLERGPAGPDGAAVLGGFVTTEALAAALPAPQDLVDEGAAYETWVLSSEGPDLAAYATKAVLAGLVSLDDALAAYAHRDELLDPAGWPTKEALLATYATPGDLPDLGEAILVADLPDMAPYAVVAEVSAVATQADVDAVLYDKDTMDAAFLAKDGALSDAQVAQIGALVAQALAVQPCPDGTVPVGDACVDVYEATIRDQPCDLPGAPLGLDGDDYPAGFPDSGADVTATLYACSAAGSAPSRFVTWFQAARACAASGARLCTNAEWQRAVAGTPDYACALDGDAPAAADAGSGCVSDHGVIDGAGSLAEWTAEWDLGGLSWVTQPAQYKAPWPLGYGDAQDRVSGWNGSAGAGGEAAVAGVPAAVVRGGSYLSGPGGGAWSIDLSRAPFDSAADVGFRCCRSR